MSRWPTYYTYKIHADFPNVAVYRAIKNYVEYYIFNKP
jgi:hypothetical protein